jgi:hypothetical protein
LLRSALGEAAPEGILALLTEVAEPVIRLLVDLVKAKLVVRFFRPFVEAGPDGRACWNLAAGSIEP